jgi:Flp pilus assembly protein TadD
VAHYRALKRDSAGAYFFGEASLFPAGNWLLNNKKADDAVLVFRLNIEEYPANWRGHDRLGAAYVGVGDTARAVASYRRSMELNPRNQNTAEVLNRLGAIRR